MGCPELSFYAVAFVCVVLMIMVACAKWGSSALPNRFFSDGSTVLEAWRKARGLGKWLIAGLVIAQIFRAGIWGAIVATATFGFPAAGAICSDIPAIIRAIGDVLKDLLNCCRSGEARLSPSSLSERCLPCS